MVKRLKTTSNSELAISSAEALDAQPRSGGSKSSVVNEGGKSSRPGKRREARSMGRYPFLNAANKYLTANKGLLAETTWSEYERRAKRMDKDFRTLVENGVIKHYNPWKMTENEILAYLKVLKARGLKPSGILHNVNLLNNILLFIGNGAMGSTRMRFAKNFPKQTSQRLKPISNSDRAKIIDFANKVDDSDWQLMLSYGITVIGICTGLRSKELRLANIGDMDLEEGIFHVEHVKGEGKYGGARKTGIQPDGMAFLKRYVKARALVIAKEAPTCEALFPALQDARKGGDGYFSQNSLSKLRANVTAQTGVTYDNRACRRTFVQTNIDMGVPIDAVSCMVGHSSTKTTEKYYGRKTTESAISDAQKVWGNTPIQHEIARVEKVNTPLIEKKSWIPGYA